MPARAPTSTPTVGASRISSFGSVASHLAMAMRCWLPPESVEIASSCWPILTPRSLTQPPTRPALRAHARSVRRQGSCPARRSPCCRRSIAAGSGRATAGPRRGRRRRRGWRRGWSRSAPACPRARSVPALGLRMPNSVSASSVRPAPSRPVRPSVSPRRTVSETSSKSPGRVRPFDLEHHRAAADDRACAPMWSNVLPVISSVMRDCVMPFVG